MSGVKLNVKIGAVEFSGEGEKEWLATQLERVLEAAPKIVTGAAVAAPQANAGAHGHVPMAADPNIATQPLASFLRDKNAGTNQVKKFLAASVWLEAKGKNRLTTADVTRALKDSNQSRIGNPADCLNKNVSKGHCEKDGKEFFVTTEGKNSL